MGRWQRGYRDPAFISVAPHWWAAIGTKVCASSLLDALLGDRPPTVDIAVLVVNHLRGDSNPDSEVPGATPSVYVGRAALPISLAPETTMVQRSVSAWRCSCRSRRRLQSHLASMSCSSTRMTRRSFAVFPPISAVHWLTKESRSLWRPMST